MHSADNKKVTINTLLTHYHPDLDAVLAIYLVRHHGEDMFPGVMDSSISFVSANELPGGKSSDQLEAEGILALDTGGGRFDTHPIAGTSNKEKWDTCASQLVAEELGVAGDKRYRYLLPFTLDQDASGKSLTSKDAVHHLIAPHGLLEGLHRLLEDGTQVIETACHLLDGLSEAAENTEPGIEEIAELFDFALALFLEKKYSPLSDHERKSLDEWNVEGVSHQVAKENGWQYNRELEKLLRLSSRLLAKSESALPEKVEERFLVLPLALPVLAEKYGRESGEFFDIVSPLLHAAIRREADWFDAIREVKRSARRIHGRNRKVVAIASRNGLVIKAARYSLGANAVLYYEPQNGLVTVQAGYKPDGRPYLDLERIASRLRAADAVKRGNQRRQKNARSIGMHHGWFLHPSLQLLNRGSPKAPDVPPTSLTYDELIEIIRSELQPEQKLPDWCCPVDKCTEKSCVFYPLRLANCHSHRRNLREQPKKGTLGDLFGDKLKNSRNR